LEKLCSRKMTGGLLGSILTEAPRFYKEGQSGHTEEGHKYFNKV